MTIPCDAPLALLAGLTPAQFMREYWQKKPLLVRAAIAHFNAPLARADVLHLAQRDDVQVRRLQHQNKASKAPSPSATSAAHWQLHNDALSAAAARTLLRAKALPKQWTLLVQSVNLYDARAAQLLAQFRFIPDARLDDLMISIAGEGGGVGPHFDSYDVFLLQAAGTRRWDISAQTDLRLIPNLPLKILRHFTAESTWELEPGDMLYLPPHYAHNGVAVGAADCMTYSIGFRSPTQHNLGTQLLQRLIDAATPGSDSTPHYRDPEQAATPTPARIPQSLQQFAQRALRRELERLQNATLALQHVLGETLSEPGAQVWFAMQDSPAKQPKGWQQLVLHRCSRMLYDDDAIYLNGEHWRASGAEALALRAFADQRYITRGQLALAPPSVQDLLHEWAANGWLVYE